MNFALDSEIFDDQYSMSICEGFFRSTGMLQRVNALRNINEGLMSELKTSQTIATELRCRVIDAERKLLERERDEKQRLLADEKYYNKAACVSAVDVDILYADLGIAQDGSQKLAMERRWLLSQGFGLFLSAFSQSEKFKSSLKRVYRAYRDVGYQSGLKDGYSYSSQGLKRKETPHYNYKTKKHLTKLDEEFGGKTTTLLAKITDNPLMSLDELKSLLAPASPSSPKSLSGDDSP
ncbi:hypothetical protein Hdeb2414_s0013g00403681 [Helianthus debilis subsp. tardiflorus]